MFSIQCSLFSTYGRIDRLSTDQNVRTSEMSVESITCYGILRISHVCYDSRITYNNQQQHIANKIGCKNTQREKLLDNTPRCEHKIYTQTHVCKRIHVYLMCFNHLAGLKHLFQFRFYSRFSAMNFLNCHSC